LILTKTSGDVTVGERRPGTASQPTSLVAETWSLGDVPNRPITTTFGAPLGGANGADGNNMDL